MLPQGWACEYTVTWHTWCAYSIIYTHIITDVYIYVCMQCNGPHNTTLVYKIHTNCLVTVGPLAIEGQNWMFHATSVHVQITTWRFPTVCTYVLNWPVGVRLSLCMEIWYCCCSLLRCPHSYHCLLGGTVGCDNDHIWLQLCCVGGFTSWNRRYNYQSDCSMLI